MNHKHQFFYCLLLVLILQTNAVLTFAQTSPEMDVTESSTPLEASRPKTDSDLEIKNGKVIDSPINFSPKAQEEFDTQHQETQPDVIPEEPEENLNDKSQDDLESRVEKLEQLLQINKDNNSPSGLWSLVSLLVIASTIFCFCFRRIFKICDDWPNLVAILVNEKDPNDHKKVNPDTCNDKTFFSLIGRIAVSLFLIIILSWLILGALPLLVTGFDLTDSGTFGDTFGFANALFSGSALVGVIVAILMQTMELRYQRKELKETRGQLERSADAATNSQKQLIKQTELSFKSTYLGSLQTLTDLLLNSKAAEAMGLQTEQKKIELKLKTLIAQLERDDLAIDIIADYQESEDSLTRKNWKQRLSHICSDMDRIYKVERGNHGQAVSNAVNKAKIYQKQIDDLRIEFKENPAYLNEMPVDLDDDLEGLIESLKGVENFDLPPSTGNTTYNMGGRIVTSSEGDYQNFWITYKTALDTFKKVLLDSFKINIS